MADVTNPDRGVTLAPLHPDFSTVSSKPAFVEIAALDGASEVEPVAGGNGDAPLPPAPVQALKPAPTEVSPLAAASEAAGGEDDAVEALNTLQASDLGVVVSALDDAGALDGVSAGPGSRLINAFEALDGHEGRAMDDNAEVIGQNFPNAAPNGMTAFASGAVGAALAGVATDDERAPSDSAAPTASPSSAAGTGGEADMSGFAGFSLAGRLGVKMTAPEDVEADAFSFTGLTTEAAPADAPLDPFSDVIDEAWADELAGMFEVDGFGRFTGAPLPDAADLEATTIDLNDPALQAPMPDGWVV